MLAEAIHSFADTGNQGCCLFGRHASRRPADEEHPVRLRQPAVLLGLHRRARAVQPGRLVLDLRRHRQAAAPARAREPGLRDRRLARRGGDGVVVVPHRASREPTTSATPARAWWQFIRHTKIPELPVVLLEDTGALVGLAFALVRRDAGATSPTNPAGTRPAASRSGSCSSSIAIVLAIEMGEPARRRGGSTAGRGRDPRRDRVARLRHADASTCAPSTSAPTRSCSRPSSSSITA